MCILPPATTAVPPPLTPARLLPPQARQQLALEALAGQPITALADQQQVSRTFVYQQLHHAHDALNHAFAPPTPNPPQLLFWLPVTKPWLRQLVLGLTLIGPSSLRGGSELLADLFDYPLSLGSVPNILHQAVARARQLNTQQDRAGVRLGAHEEIFQAGKPVLVGADVASTYCYLLSAEEHRDADTWGVRLLELTARGFAPEATSADAAAGLRKGQALALPEVPCRGDLFHALQAATPLVGYLDHRADDALATRSHLERRQAKTAHRRGRKDAALAAPLRYARVAEAQALAVAEEVATLLGWLRQDVLAVAGPDGASRCALYDWIVAELRARASLCPHRMRPVRCLLENQRDDWLAFAGQLDKDLRALAEALAVPPPAVAEVLRVLAVDANRACRWQAEATWWRRRGPCYPALREAVAERAAGVVRASSVIENLNSRLRNYFLLRRHLGRDDLELWQFFLNHRRFLGSEHAERVGKSPEGC